MQFHSIKIYYEIPQDIKEVAKLEVFRREFKNILEGVHHNIEEFLKE